MRPSYSGGAAAPGGKGKGKGKKKNRPQQGSGGGAVAPGQGGGKGKGGGKPKEYRKMPAHRLGDRTFKPKGGFKQVDKRNGVRIFEREGDGWKYARGKDGKLHRIKGSNRPGLPSGGGGVGGGGGGGNAGSGAPPSDPLAPLTPQQMRRETNAAANLRYNPEMRFYEQQIGSTNRVAGANIQQQGGWYDQYLAQVAAAEQRTAGYWAGAQATAAQMNQQAAMQAQTMQGQVAGQQAAQTAVTGVGADPALAQQAAQAAAARGQSGANFGGLLASQGASNAAYMAQQGNIAGGQKVQALTDIEQRRAAKVDELAQELAGVKRDKGAFKVEHRGKLRESEATKAMGVAAYNLDVRGQEEEERANKERERQDRRELRQLIGQQQFDNLMTIKKFRLDAKKFGADEAWRRYQRLIGWTAEERQQMSAEAGIRNINSLIEDRAGDDDGPTEATARGARENFQEALTLLRAKNVTKGNASQALVALVTEEDIPRDIARAAIQRHLYGGVGKPLRRRVKRRYGIKPRPRPRRNPNVDDALDALPDLGGI